MIFDVVTLTLKVDLLKKNDQAYDFWIRGYLLLLFLHMVAAGELCCLSDNSGCYHAHVKHSEVTHRRDVQRLKIELFEIPMAKL